MKFKLLRILENMFAAIEEAANRARDRVSYCQVCGVQRSGPACADRIRRSRGGVLYTTNSIWKYI